MNRLNWLCEMALQNSSSVLNYYLHVNSTIVMQIMPRPLFSIALKVVVY